jgi:hypothetical protein
MLLGIEVEVHQPPSTSPVFIWLSLSSPFDTDTDTGATLRSAEFRNEFSISSTVQGVQYEFSTGSVCRINITLYSVHNREEEKRPHLKELPRLPASSFSVSRRRSHGCGDVDIISSRVQSGDLCNGKYGSGPSTLGEYKMVVKTLAAQRCSRHFGCSSLISVFPS